MCRSFADGVQQRLRQLIVSFVARIIKLCGILPLTAKTGKSGAGAVNRRCKLCGYRTLAAPGVREFAQLAAPVSSRAHIDDQSIAQVACDQAQKIGRKSARRLPRQFDECVCR
jgi:hypothetical protein